jgi:nucleoside-diphosphate-sugar epimerase
VQPIHQSDVTRAIRIALDRAWPQPRSLVIAGPEPMPYAEFARAIAAACGLPRPRILPFPALPLILLARMTQHVTSRPPVRPDEIRRLLEDKAFPIDDMRTTLGFEPIPLAKGLALTFAVPQHE